MHRAIIIVLLIILFWVGSSVLCRHNRDFVEFNFINDTTDIVPLDIICGKSGHVLARAHLEPNQTYVVYLIKGKKYSIRAAGVKQEIGFADEGLLDTYASDLKLIGKSLGGLH